MRKKRGGNIGSVIFDRNRLQKCRRIPKIEHKISYNSIPLDHGGSWVQIPSGTRIFSDSTFLLEFT